MDVKADATIAGRSDERGDFGAIDEPEPRRAMTAAIEERTDGGIVSGEIRIAISACGGAAATWLGVSQPTIRRSARAVAAAAIAVPVGSAIETMRARGTDASSPGDATSKPSIVAAASS